MDKLLYRVDETGIFISRSRSQIYELLKKGELVAHNPNHGGKGLRITADSIKAYVEKYKIPASEF